MFIVRWLWVWLVALFRRPKVESYTATILLKDSKFVVTRAASFRIQEK